MNLKPLLALAILLLAAAPVKASEGEVMTFQPGSDEPNPWQVGTSMRFCSVRGLGVLPSGADYTITRPDSTTFDVDADEADCGSMLIDQAGTYTITFDESGAGLNIVDIRFTSWQDTQGANYEQLASDVVFWLPALFFGTMMLWSLWNGWRLPALAATLGFMAPIVDAPGFGRLGGVFLFILFTWLTYYTQNKERNGLTEA